MKNIHVIPTQKPSRFGYIFESESYHIFTNGENPNDIADNLAHYRNIYITSDEEIKKGDYFYLYDADIIAKYVSVKPVEESKKIILTTDPDLIADGVQAIDDEFLQWFVKNPKCEEVEVVMKWEGNSVMFGWKMGNVSSDGEFIYKIIIPIEEPKQETIELQPNLFNAFGGIACVYSVTANLRYAMKLIKIDVDTFHSVLRLQQMWQGSDGSQKWEWVEIVD
jgi:hypothetical protein